MLRRCVPALGLGWHESSFTKAALEVINLHQSHRQLVEDAGSETKDALEVRDLFGRALERVRPLYSVDAGLASNKFYSIKLYRALRHFGATTDPLFESLDRQLSYDARKLRPKVQRLKLQGLPVRSHADLQLLGGEHDMRPQELPVPPDHADMSLQLPKDRPRFHHKYRGHWVLRDPEIAITKEERKEDPW